MDQIFTEIGKNFANWLNQTFLVGYVSNYDPIKSILYFRSPKGHSHLVTADFKSVFNRTFDKYYQDNRTTLFPNISSYEIIYPADYRDGEYYENGDIAIIFRKYEPQIGNLLGVIPIELVRTMAMNLNNQQLDDICSTNSNFKTICKDNEFWRNLIIIKFGNFPPPVSSTIYDYRKIYYALNDNHGGINQIENSIINLFLNLRKYNIRNITTLAEMAKYLYNTNSEFRDTFTLGNDRDSRG